MHNNTLTETVYVQQERSISALEFVKNFHNSAFIIRSEGQTMLRLRLTWAILLTILVWPASLYMIAIMLLTGSRLFIVKPTGVRWRLANLLAFAKKKNTIGY